MAVLAVLVEAVMVGLRPHPQEELASAEKATMVVLVVLDTL